ncbi:MAG: hypothetical protein HWN66_04985 [Candidatus Helarchaeota archaeon]|nr:hypothetical protein [Candidatus Helarchaeota archaeon]
MSPDSARLLPIVAEALNDIYSKIEDTNRKLGLLEKNFQEVISSIGQKNMIIIQNLKKLQGAITELNTEDKLKHIILLVVESISDIQDGIWFLEFQNALSRFKEKLDEF